MCLQKNCSIYTEDKPIKTVSAQQQKLCNEEEKDILWRDSNSCPTEEQYKDMVLDKTGGLFRLAVGLMQAFSDNKTEFQPLLNELALYFQIRDDYVNISSAWYKKTKGFCEDITEGKFSFPIIHSVRSNLEDHRLLNILKQRTEDEEIKQYAVQWMEQTGSLQYTREVINHHKEKVLEEIEKLGGHPLLARIIVELDRQLDDRHDRTSSNDDIGSKVDTL
mmetsp:Transcript_14727/g.32675  ORF Transcript_14727/g.32675 Transcript_14727/m.32675 type:complete len:220 (+) Transcript_14727:189-848(+)